MDNQRDGEEQGSWAKRGDKLADEMSEGIREVIKSTFGSLAASLKFVIPLLIIIGGFITAGRHIWNEGVMRYSAVSQSGEMARVIASGQRDHDALERATHSNAELQTRVAELEVQNRVLREDLERTGADRDRTVERLNTCTTNTARAESARADWERAYHRDTGR